MRITYIRLLAAAFAGTLLLVLFTPAAARAASITVTGGFTSFTGMSAGMNATGGVSAGCNPFLQGIVAGAAVQAPSCTGPSALWGPVTYPLATLASFEFFERTGEFGNLTDAAHNALSFTPAGPQTVASLGDEFLLGTLSFTNGIWFGSGTDNRFHLQLTTHSDPGNPFDGHVLSDDIVMYITGNCFAASPCAGGVVNTPDQNSDFVFFNTFHPVGSIRAYERQDTPNGTNTVTAQLFGRIGSLTPVRFANATGGFISGSTDPLTNAAVPEPMSLILLGTGVVVLLARRGRR